MLMVLPWCLMGMIITYQGSYSICCQWLYLSVMCKRKEKNLCKRCNSKAYIGTTSKWLKARYSKLNSVHGFCTNFTSFSTRNYQLLHVLTHLNQRLRVSRHYFDTLPSTIISVHKNHNHSNMHKFWIISVSYFCLSVQCELYEKYSFNRINECVCCILKANELL